MPVNNISRTCQNQGILEYFDVLKKRDLIGSSYIFIGNDFSLVKDIIKLINCNQEDGFCGSCWDCKNIDKGWHPDLFVIEPEGLTVRISSIREGMRFLSLKSFRLSKKILMIKGGEKLSIEAANAFLKTLEEPPNNSFIAICASKLEGFLPTIISRCRKIFLSGEIADQNFLDTGLVSGFLRGQKIGFAGDKKRKEFSSFLWSLILLLHNSLLTKIGRKNNQLLQNREDEIILSSYSASEISDILGYVLKIYGACNSVNINLALNLIKLKVQIHKSYG